MPFMRDVFNHLAAVRCASKKAQEAHLEYLEFHRRRKLTQAEINVLKARIIGRLRSQDYKCYMPEEWHIVKSKPRVRHKLQKRVIMRWGFVAWVYR